MAHKYFFTAIAFCFLLSCYAQPCLTGGITLRTQAEIDNFPINYPNCTVINGRLSIEGGADILNLDGLSAITAIQGDLNIVSNWELMSLSGLANLSVIGGSLNIYDNIALGDLEGLNNLMTINGSLIIEDNGLSNLTALSNLQTINGVLYIGYESISSLQGLQNINPASISYLTLEVIPSLSQCAVASICQYIDNGGESSIRLTRTGCADAADISNNCQRMPIELSYFKLNQKDNMVQLRWETATEHNNEGFDIERSNDGLNYQTIGFQKGQGTTSNSQFYQFVDEQPKLGANYYRLKQRDLDGAFSYSGSIFTQITQLRNLFFSPNPTHGRIDIGGADIKEGQIKVWDAMGKLLKEEPITDNYLDLSALNTGVYWVVLQNNVAYIAQKVIKY